MSELESRRLSVPALVPTRSSLGPGADELDADLPPEETRTREGLPGFRMRHDAHYVDQLAGRSPVPQVRAIPVRDIDARGAANAHDLEPLARSIGRHGVLQPLQCEAVTAATDSSPGRAGSGRPRSPAWPKRRASFTRATTRAPGRSPMQTTCAHRPRRPE